jgi:hypothetical protein
VALEMTTRNAKSIGVLLELGVLCLVWVGIAVTLQFAKNAPSERLSNEVLRVQHNGAHFVFADLDGDQKPDLALVETQGQTSEATNYAIRLQFSRGMESLIGVRAPFGGLRVAARDVNGDDSLDLVLTSNLDTTFIEVLLNDGHGNFSAAPADILEKIDASEFALNGPAGPQLDRAVAALLRSSLEDGVAADGRYDQVFSSTAGSRVAVEPVLHRPVLLQLGRSPPRKVFL